MLTKIEFILVKFKHIATTICMCQVTLSWGELTASGGVIIPNRILINDEIKKYPTSLDKTRYVIDVIIFSRYHCF